MRVFVCAGAASAGAVVVVVVGMGREAGAVTKMRRHQPDRWNL